MLRVMAGPRLLVAGSSGQVARSLASLVPADRLTTIGRPDLDLTNRASIEWAIMAIRPDVVINAAAYTAVDLAEAETTVAFAVNAEGPGMLASATSTLGIPLIHLSTDYVFDGSKKSVYTERDPTGPASEYGKSKLAGEQRVAEAGAGHIILRTSWVYSAFGKNFVKTMLRLAETRQEVAVVHDQIGNPTSANDIAAAALQIANRLHASPDEAPRGLFHLAGTGAATWAEFAEFIFETSACLGGPSARVRRITTAEYPTPVKRPANSQLDCAQLAESYSITLPPLRESTRLCVKKLIETGDWSA
jgi:dTDP-4-dehydrorhamnose reductase